MEIILSVSIFCHFCMFNCPAFVVNKQGRTGPLGCLALPSGPVGPASRWAVTSKVEVGQTTYPVNRGRVGREGREGSKGQSHKGEEREGERGIGDGARDH